MARITRLALVSLLAAFALLAAPLTGAAGPLAPEPRAGSPARHIPLAKDGKDDSSGGSGSGDSSGDSGSNGSGSGGNDTTGGSEDTGDAAKEDPTAEPSDDGSGGSGSDDTSADDNGGGSGGGGSDDTSGDDHGSDGSGGGNDDFSIAAPVQSPDGVEAPVVDNDGNADTDGYRALQAIVRLQPGTSIDEFNGRHGTAVVAAITSRDLYLLQLPDGRSELDVEREIAVDPATRWTELNFITQVPEGRPGYFFVSGAPSPGATVDYAPALLGVTAAQQCVTGTGATVAVLDTGIDASHPALAGRVEPGWNALNNSTDVTDEGNGRDDDADGLVDEMAGHGTHVAGIVAAVAPGARILPVKVLTSDGSGDAFFVAAGIYYAVDQGAQVINLSLGSTYDARVIAEAAAEASEAGVLVVAAAGNAGTDSPLQFPAANAGVISVAATDAQDLKTGFSNFGDSIDIAAPGTDIVSALPGGQYAAWSGTSMSAPFVAGTAALVVQAHPTWSSPQIGKRLFRTADDLDESNPDFAGELGAGRLDSARAVDCDPAAAA